jgi:ankyrin repeat protein
MKPEDKGSESGIDVAAVTVRRTLITEVEVTAAVAQQHHSNADTANAGDSRSLDAPLRQASGSRHPGLLARMWGHALDLCAEAFDWFVSLASRSHRLARSLQQGDTRRVRKLLEGGIDVKKWVREPDHARAVWWTAHHGHAACIACLVEHGLDPNWRKEPWEEPLLPLMMQWHYWSLREKRDLEAAQKEHEAAVRLLLDRGADVNGKTSSSGTPLHMAADYDDQSLATLLIERGANTTTRHQRRTPLMIARRNGSSRVEALLRSVGVER